MAPLEAATARERSAELRGLLEEITREHGVNRALMRQELAFLDHLMRLVGQEPQAGYRRPRGAAPPPSPPAPRHRRPAEPAGPRPPRPRPPGLTVSNVSTFMGLQTSLRGLLAHQRSIDVT